MRLFIKLFICFIFFSSCSNGQANKSKDLAVSIQANKNQAVAAFAEGCFWCSEHIFDAVLGVDSVISGYAGGHTKNPTYESVNTETTGHAETVLVYYNPSITNFKNLVNVFFASHDPTTLNQQGPDVGSSYRSILFYQSNEELEIAKETIRELSASNAFKNNIVTELAPLKAFYRAENYHQDYILNHPNHPYVLNVSIPRYKNFLKKYKGKLKSIE